MNIVKRSTCDVFAWLTKYLRWRWLDIEVSFRTLLWLGTSQTEIYIWLLILTEVWKGLMTELLVATFTCLLISTQHFFDGVLGKFFPLVKLAASEQWHWSSAVIFDKDVSRCRQVPAVVPSGFRVLFYGHPQSLFTIWANCEFISG